MLSSDAVQSFLHTNERSLVADVYPRWLGSGQVITGKVEQIDYDDLGTPERISMRIWLRLKVSASGA